MQDLNNDYFEGDNSYKYHFINKQLPLQWLRSGCRMAAISRVTDVRLSTASHSSSSSYCGWLHGGMAGWKIGTDHDHRFSFQDGGQVRLLQVDAQ